MRLIPIPLLALPLALAAEPLPPAEMKLDPMAIHEIVVGAGHETLVVFPRPVTLVLGHGLTAGERPGRVQFQQAEQDPRILVLRQLGEGAATLAHAVMDGSPYVFKLVHGVPSASVVYLRTDKETPPAAQITPAQLRVAKPEPSPRSVAELVRLAREANFLRPRLPREYQGYTARKVRSVSDLGGGLRAEVTGVARFAGEDTLVVTGEVGNASSEYVTLDPDHVELKVGDGRHYAFSRLEIDRTHLLPGGETGFAGALVGDGKGAPLHLSTDNEFTLQPASKPKK